MKLVWLWVEKYVEQGVSRPAAKAMTYVLFLLALGSALAATLVGIYLLAGGDDSVENARGYGLASILLGNGVAAGALLWARIKREPPWLPWAAGGGLAIAVVASVANVVFGLVACVVVVLVLAGVIVRLGRQRGYSAEGHRTT